MIIALVVGVAVCLVMVTLVVIVCVRRTRREKGFFIAKLTPRYIKLV